MSPAADAAEAWPSSLVIADLSCPSPLGVLVLRDGGGDAVDALMSQHHDTHQIRLTPIAALRTSADYSVRLDVGAAGRDWSFRTGSWGAPVVGAIDKLALSLRVDDAFLPDPWDPSSTLQTLLREEFHPVIQLLGAPDAGAITLRLGARGGANPQSGQDGTRPTLDLGGSWANPRIVTDPADLRWDLGGVELRLEAASWEIDVAQDLDGGRARLRANWDLRPLTDGATRCAESGCEPCADGEVACVPLWIDAIPADRWAGVLVPIS
jgi:hypothetical protein